MSNGCDDDIPEAAAVLRFVVWRIDCWIESRCVFKVLRRDDDSLLLFLFTLLVLFDTWTFSCRVDCLDDGCCCCCCLDVDVYNAMVDILILGFIIMIDDEDSLLFTSDAVLIGDELHAETEDIMVKIMQSNSNMRDGIAELLLSIITPRRLLLDWDLSQFQLSSP